MQMSPKALSRSILTKTSNNKQWNARIKELLFSFKDGADAKVDFNKACVDTLSRQALGRTHVHPHAILSGAPEVDTEEWLDSLEGQLFTSEELKDNNITNFKVDSDFKSSSS